MAEINWQAKIYRHRGPFIHTDDLEGYSHMFQLLSGAQKFEDEPGWEGDSDPLELINPLYDAEIEAIRKQWEDKETEAQQQDEHIKDITEKVAKRIAGKQWVARFACPGKWPRLSHWSKAQHRFVVDMLVRYWATGVPANPPASEAKDVHRLMKFISDMREEQEEYFAFAKEVNATQLSRYNFINYAVDRYIDNHMRNKICHMKSAYPSHYQQQKMLPLAPSVGQPPNFYPTSEPLELGEIPICVIPNMTSYTDLKRQTVFLEHLFPSEAIYPKQTDVNFTPCDGSYLYKMPVSADPNVALLSAQQEFDVVSSPSALKTLLDNSAPSWDRQWEVPVTVRLVPAAQAGTYKRVAFLDKPLPPRSMNNVERNGRAHKRTARILVCKRVFGPGPFDYSIWTDQPDRRDKREFRDKILEKKKNKGKKKAAKKRKQLKLKRQQDEERANCQSTKRPRQDSSPSEDESESGAGPDTPGARPDTPSESLPGLYTDGALSTDSDSEGAELQIDCPESEEGLEEEAADPAHAGGGDGDRGEDEEQEEAADPAHSGGGDGGRGEAGKPGCGAESEGPSAAGQAMASGGGSRPDSATERRATGTEVAGRPRLPGGSGGDGGGAGCTAGRTQNEARDAAVAGETEAATSAADEAEAAEAAEGEGKPKKDTAGYLRPPPGLNVHYRVWQLGGLRLLLRASTHAMRINPNAGLVRYTVHAKPAYQPALGIEVLTRTEVISQWLDCLLRPNSRIVRVHLDPLSQTVITPEERTLAQLTEEFVKYDTGFRPQYGLQVLESLLRELTSLTPGQYLLSHDSRSGPFVRLSHACEPSASGGVDLHQSFPLSPMKVALESPRCLSIDPSILTPFNTVNGVVPATFRYKNQPELEPGGWKKHWADMKEKGITKKKKGKKKNNTKTKKQNADEPAVSRTN